MAADGGASGFGLIASAFSAPGSDNLPRRTPAGQPIKNLQTGYRYTQGFVGQASQAPR